MPMPGMGMGMGGGGIGLAGGLDPVGPVGYSPPHHRMPIHSRNEVSQCVSMTCRARATGPADIARQGMSQDPI